MKASARLIDAMAVTLELTNTTLSDPAVQLMLADLVAFPEVQVLAALRRCCREVKSRLTLADILQRIEDGRPTPEMAWSMVPKAEAESACWTTEMRDAYMLAYPLIASGDNVQARMAFLEAYRAQLQSARDARQPVQWCFTPGTDKSLRELVVLDAVEKGRISAKGAAALLPYHHEDDVLNARLLAAGNVFKRLEEKAA